MDSELSAALEKIRFLRGVNNSNLKPISELVGTKTPSQDNLSDAFLRKYVSEQVKDFTSSDIFAKSSENNISRGEIKGAIYRAIESGFMKLVAAGKGRRPSVYSKP